jgi:antitoxin HicB
VSEYGYTVIYEALAEGGYQVIVPALPGIVTYGRALEEAREMARDTIVCHLRGLLKDGEEIPEDPFARSQPSSKN